MAHENSGGAGCAPQPSVEDTTTPETQVEITTVGSQVQVVSTTVLVPAHFKTSDTEEENLDSKEIYLTPESEAAITATKVTGSWFASEGDNDFAGSCGGTYELVKD